jgi:hypothetical protein
MTTLVRSGFDYYINGGTLTIDSTMDPKLHITNLSSSPTLNVAPQLALVPTQGVTTGFLSMAATGSVSSGSQKIGLVFMQSQRDMAPGGGGTGYEVALHVSTLTLNVRKLTNGLRTAPTLLATLALGGVVASLSVLWILSPLNDWVLMVISVNGTEVLRYQDFDTPYITSVTEGIFYDDGGSGNPFDITWLSTTMSGPP